MTDSQYPKHKDDGLTGDVHEVNEKGQEFQGDEEDEEEILDASESDQLDAESLDNMQRANELAEERDLLQARIDKALARLREHQNSSTGIVENIDELINILEGNA